MKKYKTSTIVIMTLAGFMILMMVLSPLIAFFWGSDESDNIAQPAPESDIDDRIPLNNAGKLIDHRFDSIADGLNMSPPGVVVAQYVRAEDLEGTPLMDVIPYRVYGTNVSHSYSANFRDGTWIGLHTLDPRKFSFEFIVSPSRYNNYMVLIRDKNLCNIMGDPCIMGPRSKVEETVDVIENENAPNAYPNFRELLECVDLDAPYQEVRMYSQIADKYHDAMCPVGDQCERTITCIGISENSTVSLNELAANTTDEIECNVTFDQGDLNLTIARITGNFSAVMDAKIY